uniref:Uncharacterized protein n=1 Tax=Anguilla anguilla TaxID=7936 RepID=A0A0E9U3M2_ANGAN
MEMQTNAHDLQIGPSTHECGRGYVAVKPG